MNEIWKVINFIPTTRTYEISSYGRLRRDAVLQSGTATGHGYWAYSIHNQRYLAHRLVALAFLPNPEGKRTVNHKDLNKSNNLVSNLEWATDLENIQHGRSFLGNYNAVGEKSAGARITEEQAIEILSLRGGEETTRSIGFRYGVSHVVVTNIWTGRTWRHLSRDNVPPTPKKLARDSVTGRIKRKT